MRRAVLGLRAHHGLLRAALRVVALSAVALACSLVAWSWLSGSVTNSTVARSSQVSGVSLRLASFSGVSWPRSEPLPPPSCETSQGLYPFPDAWPSGWSRPPLVPDSGSLQCWVLDGSALRELPAFPEPAPSTSPELQELAGRIDRLVAISLYSAGLMIFLLAVVAMRARR